MRIIPTAEIAAVLDYPSLIDRIRDYIRGGYAAPKITPFSIFPDNDPEEASLSIRPAWRVGGYIGVAISTDFAGNAVRNLPQRMGTYLLISGQSGAPLALLDGLELTLRSRAAMAALAARYLARPDCERLLMIGANALAAHLIRAHRSQRPICNILIWDEDQAKAKQIAGMMNRPECRVDVTDDLEQAVRGADIVCCNPTAGEVPLQAEWLQPGQHLDMTSQMPRRLIDLDDRIKAKTAVFTDNDRGMREDILGSLATLARGEGTGRNKYNSITLFHYGGSGLEELAGAKMAFERS